MRFVLPVAALAAIAVPPVAALAAIATPAAAVAQAVTDPAIVPVQALDAGLLAIMKVGTRAGVSGRAAQIGPVVDRSFDIPLMTRLAVGPGWTGFAPADQTALVAAFRRLTVNTYARNFDAYSGQSFTIAPQVDTRIDKLSHTTDKLVRTSLVDPSGSPIAIAYRLRQSGNGWRIIDVNYKSISQLTTRRSDFAQVLAQGGAKALVAHLDAMAAKGAG
ncbi:ABC transporter substrate-binding protein [uncultured Sphingomonas sp.]|uniref:ABC transporter substrate-binding protein n=1 Tax=uncultured Sphingomonas sp. TaxID=158754 RepID=UPI0035CA1521